MMQPQPSNSLLRARWAAIGAAVAVTLGFGTFSVANATISAGVRNVFVPIVPCRLLDTRRAPSTIGSRGTPIVAGEQFRAQVRGSNGNCVIPDGATAVVLNVTALDPVGAGYLQVWPADAAQPNSSSLNFSNGQAPVANAVTAQVGAEGGIKFYTSATSVDVITDIVGYYEDHNHSDTYLPKGGTTAPKTTTTAPATTTTTLAPVANGNALRARIAATSPPAVVIVEAGIYEFSSTLTVPVGISLKGAGQGSTILRGTTTPFLLMTGGGNVSDLSITGGGGTGAGFQVETPGAVVTVRNVSVNMSSGNGTFYNSGDGQLVLDHVFSRGGYGINNGGSGSMKSSVITITNSDIDSVTENSLTGSISVSSSSMTPTPDPPLGPYLAGATVYGTAQAGGTITLDNVTITSQFYGVRPDAGSIIVTNSRINSPKPRYPTVSNGVAQCSMVSGSNGAALGPDCF